jgi:23S rRNA-/tRNA-specific pseudouridylate synthase
MKKNQSSNRSDLFIVHGEIRIPVLACGSAWLVVDKPCGMSIHNDPGKDLCSISLAAIRAGRLSAMRPDLHTIHAVHRIDRDTSGIVMLAGDTETLAFFGGQFAAKTVAKRYLAIVHGQVAAPGAGQQGIEWNWPLTDSAAGRRNPVGKGKLLPCATRCRIVGYSRHYTLIECEPVTGRKHQIRRHAKLAGHPIVGDRRYGSPASLAFLRRQHHFDRLGLHAHSLTIRLPDEDHPTAFQTVGLPKELQQLMEADRNEHERRLDDRQY